MQDLEKREHSHEDTMGHHNARASATDFSIAAIMAKNHASRSQGDLEVEKCLKEEEEEEENGTEEEEEGDEEEREGEEEEDVDVDGEGKEERKKKKKGSERNNKTQVNPQLRERCNSEDLRGVQCHLETKELWDKFHELGTEMIITKTGRRMFPTVRVSFSGLKAGGKFGVLLDVVPVDGKRYRYAYHRSSWLVAGKADPPAPPRLYPHPDSPFSSEQLRKQVVSFEKVKLTNNEMDKQGQVRTLRHPH
ncbi:unnamed protein product [Darwinula stevensoni]|uniref:T-box domain-containing protein n=1 Tax=Darwinula stevensoni TaxID=69355 RepID=A0A7R9AEH6_9CRUS|nr:unnamed protein product [Darwinula stevensoni]CAG0901999.1 unnamed protein product [Darwinula stevensoni]